MISTSVELWLANIQFCVQNKVLLVSESEGAMAVATMGTATSTRSAISASK